VSQSSKPSTNKSFEVSVLGSGTSQGVPVIACECEVCQSQDPKDKRLRSSILLRYHGYNVVIDTGPDFRIQMLNEKVKSLEAVVFTHEHKDHVAGLDDVRAFNFKEGGKPMKIFATENVQKALKREYAYVLAADKYPGIPVVDLHTIKQNPFYIQDAKWIPIDVLHYKMPVKAFRLENFAYLTDANYISEKEKGKLKGLDVLILNCLRKRKHLSHFNLEEAIALIEELKPKQTYLTHISHLMGKHAETEKLLPENVNLCYDGLQIKLK